MVESIVKEVHIKHWMQAKEGGNVELYNIVTHSLGDGIRFILKWTKISMRSCKVFFLQVQPKFISHLKVMWHPLLIMALLVLGIGLIKNIMNLLTDVLDSFNESGGFVGFILHMGQFCLCGRKG
jgi:hypothetical protein